MKFFLFVLAALPVLLIAGACGGDDGPSDEEIQQALQIMVLQPDEVPEGLQSIGTSFADNEQASSGIGGGATKEQLDEWGRILGYSSDFQTGDPNPATFTNALSTQVTLYDDDGGASDSFTDRVSRARGVDWESTTDLIEFQQEELNRDVPADDYYWVRLTGLQPTSSSELRLVSNDIVIFRVDRAWGYLNVVSQAAAGVNDRKFADAAVNDLLLKQIENTHDGLNSDLLG